MKFYHESRPVHLAAPVLYPHDMRKGDLVLLTTDNDDTHGLFYVVVRRFFKPHPDDRTAVRIGYIVKDNKE